jgi:hypothetical protein
MNRRVRRTTRLWPVSLILILGMQVFAAQAVAASSHTFDRVYPLAPGGTFRLDNVNGSVHVEGWARNQVEVRAVKVSSNVTSHPELVNIDVESGPGNVAVHTHYPGGDGTDVAVEYDIHVPSGVLLQGVGTVNGDVRVRGVDGGGDLKSVNGDVEVVDSRGRFSAHTTNGNVHLELRSLPDGQPMRISTVNGSLVVALPRESNAELTALSMNGACWSDLPIELQGGLSSHFCHGRLGAGGGEVLLNTVNGGIRVVADRAD